MIINWLAFYLSWWGIAYFASDDNYLYCLLILLIHLVIHFLVVVKNNKIYELIFILKISFFGFFVDLLFNQFNLLSLNKKFYIWGIFIWIIFSTTLNHSLFKIFSLKKWAIFLLFFIFGPLSYLMAQKLNLVLYPTSIIKILIHAFFWGAFSLMIKKIMESHNEVRKND